MVNLLRNGINYLLENIINISTETKLGNTISFFLVDIIYIFILLFIIVFVITYIRTYLPPQKMKAIVNRFDNIIGHIFASLFGAISPFCSCSSVPIFIGFIESRIPLGITFSFLITSPILNEAVFALLIGIFGFKVAVIYTLIGITIGVIGGIIIGIFKLENEVEDYVYNIEFKDLEEKKPTQLVRLKDSLDFALDIISKIWLFVIIGIAIGAVIHGYVPTELITNITERNSFLSVLFAVIVGVPLYSDTLGTVIIAQALYDKGVGLGTIMALMMSITALSLPQFILLRRVIKPKLIAIFIAVVAVSIIIVGNIFNLIQGYII